MRVLVDGISQEKYASTFPKCLNFTQIEYRKEKFAKGKIAGRFFFRKEKSL